MIRPFTLLCFCAFAGAGAWLYQVKHSVAVKDRELAGITRETEQARQRVDVLRAEWALLNEPDRLRQTAMRMLSLEPMQPQQFLRVSHLDRRLPTAVAFAGAPDIFADPVTPEAPAVPQAAVMLASARTPAPSAPVVVPAPAPAQPAVATAPEAPAPRALAAAVAAQRAEQASRLAARPAPAPAPVLARVAPPRPAQPTQPIQPAVHVTPAPAPAPAVTRVTRTQTQPTTIASAVGTVSALGSATSLGRPMLAPPVPIGSAAAATLR